MKKILAILLAVCLMAALVACGETATTETTEPAETTVTETAEAPAAETASLVGTWEYKDGGYIYTFNEDGTGNYDAGSDMPFTYTTDGETVAITFEGNTSPMELKYTIEGSKLTIFDSFGDPTIYNKK